MSLRSIYNSVLISGAQIDALPSVISAAPNDATKFLNGQGNWTTPNVGGAVTSVFGRTGVVSAQSGDYTAAQVTHAVDTTGSYADPSWITSLAGSKITGSVVSAKTGRYLFDLATTTGTITIAHGLGKTPALARFTCGIPLAFASMSWGASDGTNNDSINSWNDGSPEMDFSNSKCINIRVDTSNYQQATVTLDATNITIHNVKTGTPSGTACVIWEAIG